MGYTIYGGELSYFSRKLEAAMIFYQADFEFKPKGPDNAADIEHRSGTHQVPVLHTPENWMIGDTTPLMMMLDGRFPQRRMFPEGAPGVFVHVLEEYFDEWIARTMVHYYGTMKKAPVSQRSVCPEVTSRLQKGSSVGGQGPAAQRV